MIVLNKNEIENKLEEIKHITECPTNFICLKLGLDVFQKMNFDFRCIECSDFESENCPNVTIENAIRRCACPVTKFLAEKFSS